MSEQGVRPAFRDEGIEKEKKCPEAFAITEKNRYFKDRYRSVLQYAWGKNPGLPAWLFQINHMADDDHMRNLRGSGSRSLFHAEFRPE